MPASEQSILSRLLFSVRELCRRVVWVVAPEPAPGAAAAPRPLPPDPGRAWILELWWTHLVDQLVDAGYVSRDVGDTLRAALGQLVDQLTVVVAGGGGYDEINAEVARFLSGWEGWARRMAVTESTRLASEAILASAEAQRPGALKEWVTNSDPRVREAHRDVQGKRVPVAGVWYVDGWAMRYPGDPLAPPDLILGCRCRPKIVEGGS